MLRTAWLTGIHRPAAARLINLPGRTSFEVEEYCGYPIHTCTESNTFPGPAGPLNYRISSQLSSPPRRVRTGTWAAALPGRDTAGSRRPQPHQPPDSSVRRAPVGAPPPTPALRSASLCHHVTLLRRHGAARTGRWAWVVPGPGRGGWSAGRGEPPPWSAGRRR